MYPWLELGDVADRSESKISATDVLGVFVSSSDPALVPSEVGDALGITSQGARYHLERLVAERYLEKKKPGERTVLYWITDEGRTYYVANVQPITDADSR
jgi:predicted transcriptional regulator